MKYIIRGLSKFTEEDNFKEGCLPDTGAMVDIDYTFTGNTPDEVIERAAAFIGIYKQDLADSVEKNAGDDPGRVDFCRTEDADGDELIGSAVKLWKQGKIKAWYAVYTGYVEQLTPVSL